MTVDVGPEQIVLEVSDTGRPFNPISLEAPAAATSLEEAPIGGQGLVLVRKAAQDIAYEHSGGRNRVTVVIARE